MTPTAADYAAAFETERVRTYPAIDALEQRLGYAIDRERLESAARVLACPVKKHPPCWQHGRVLYAVARHYLATHQEPVQFLDIGTAKGFSALCLLWAAMDANVGAAIVSVDVIDPHAAERRNTVAEVDGPKTLAQTLAPWPEAPVVQFLQSTGIAYLERHPERVHLAFIDGKHTGAVVRCEAQLLAERQQPGDVIVFDDVQIPGVAEAVADVRGYDVEYVRPLLHRAYAIARRK